MLVCVRSGTSRTAAVLLSPASVMFKVTLKLVGGNRLPDTRVIHSAKTKKYIFFFLFDMKMV